MAAMDDIDINVIPQEISFDRSSSNDDIDWGELDKLLEANNNNKMMNESIISTETIIMNDDQRSRRKLEIYRPSPLLLNRMSTTTTSSSTLTKTQENIFYTSDIVPAINVYPYWGQTNNQEPQMETINAFSIPIPATETRTRKVPSKNGRWTIIEHMLFLKGLNKFGYGQWTKICALLGDTRTPAQVSSHAQNYYNKMMKKEDEAGAVTKNNNNNKKMLNKMSDGSWEVEAWLPGVAVLAVVEGKSVTSMLHGIVPAFKTLVPTAVEMLQGEGHGVDENR
ncbi:hypothetical protein G4B88_001848 [Cannabis sativa]|uniref:Uncharacterized protein n=1 Tax=Cannabis sativa TaxID=3483 RepID=A0A7J6I278_CANSA|nr:hypothetical protein G4B88_001848 [Cannabis sativa]